MNFPPGPPPRPPPPPYVRISVPTLTLTSEDTGTVYIGSVTNDPIPIGPTGISSPFPFTVKNSLGEVVQVEQIILNIALTNQGNFDLKGNPLAEVNIFSEKLGNFISQVPYVNNVFTETPPQSIANKIILNGRGFFVNGSGLQLKGYPPP